MPEKSARLLITILLVSILTLAFSIRRAEADGGIRIMADGSVQGTTYVQTTDNVTYVFTSDINGYIIIDRDNISLDGRGHSLSGDYGSAAGIYLENRINVTVRNLAVYDHYYAILLRTAHSCTIFRCSGLSESIGLDRSSNNVIAENSIESSSNYAIWLSQSDNNIVCENTVISTGISISGSNSNRISRNRIVGASTAIVLPAFSTENGPQFSSNNIVTENWIENNSIGIEIQFASNNTIYHNNFMGNAQQVYVTPGHPEWWDNNFWDNNYPSGGNYWSNYNGTDQYQGTSQNETGSDGIGDSPYIIDANNTDHYPLVTPRVPLFGDVNHDGVVNLKDVMAAVQAFNSFSGQLRWDPDADVDNSGHVDMRDIVTIVFNFNKR